MLDDATARQLAKLFASKYIARPDVYAKQHPGGAWMPVTNPDGSYAKIGMKQLLDHMHGRASYGHYLLNQDNKCKFFAFDIDLEEAKPDKGIYYPLPSVITGNEWSTATFQPGDPRSAWRNPRSLKIVRQFLVHQLLGMANIIADQINSLLEIPVAVSYSGSKGVHVYGFTGLVDAVHAREGALMVIEALRVIEPLRGNNFFKHKDTGDPIGDYPQLSIEIFPKQDTLEHKKLGNLMRLPLGRNFKGDEAFFIDIGNTVRTEFHRRDPVEALTVVDPWQGPR
jgi:hypothetical protein